jgi:hypothetical protein
MDLGPNVFIITTQKKGGKTLTVDYNFQYGSGKIAKTVDVFDDSLEHLLQIKDQGM